MFNARRAAINGQALSADAVEQRAIQAVFSDIIQPAPTGFAGRAGSVLVRLSG